ncbi:MAG: hypothetical protein PHP95_06775 [Desulfuromonadaceae bacterium]|nr:hypothetical protein [Desulfuromonadaceae bacterium]MDD2848145.1 hypothetical protein [Desulfuromonadaceae bacterium]MDD4132014.1 hypothetical protein [Desulfuromonadaceae bacterium]
MKRLTIKAGILALCISTHPPLAIAESPLFMPSSESSPPLMSATDVEGLKKEAETLKRKAELLKTAADKKYSVARDLRKKAGGFRSESSQKGELLRSQAEQSAAVSGFIGDMFNIMSSMGGGQMSSNSALTASLTGKMIQGQQSMDAKGVMEAQNKAGQIGAEAEKKAGPLEMRADELENEGNRLMEAHNRLMGIVNAKSLLVAADELEKKVSGDGRQMEQLRERSRELVTSMVGH